MDGELRARNDVIDVINRLFISTDLRDWQAVRGCFAASVLFDMSSAGGGPPARLTAQEITDGWDGGLRALKSIHHQAGNYQVTVAGKEATAFCYGIAYHHRPVRSGRNTRTFVGSYDFGLILTADGWKLNAFRFNLKFIDGNLELHQEPGA
jgi:hypothetical protein